MSETPKMIDQTPPRTTDTKDVAKVKIANVNNKMMATTNEMMGANLGKQWVRVIFKSPNPRAIIKV